MKKKVLIIIPELTVGSGAALAAIIIGDKLVKEQYNVQYLTFHKTENHLHLGKETCLNQKRQKGKYIGRLIFLYYMIQRAFIISKICKEQQIDTCISHIEEANFSTILSKILGNKSKIIAHNVVSRNGLNKIKNRLIDRLYPYADWIITISEEEKKLFEKLQKTKAIYSAFDKEEILEAANKENPIQKNGKFIFINIGRLSEEKNQNSLIDAFEKCYKKYKNIQLIILGNGELKEELQKKVSQLESKNNIQFVPSQVKPPFVYLKNSDCFVFSSIHEGFGRVLIEAAICGLPIITTDCLTGPSEIISDGVVQSLSLKKMTIEKYGIITPTYDTEQLYFAMEKIYKDKQLRDSLKSASKELIKKFDINTIYEQWAEII